MKTDNKEQIRKDAKEEFELEKKKEELLKKTSDALVKGVDYTLICEQIIEENPIYYDKNKLWWLWDDSDCRWLLVDEIDILNQIRYTLASKNFGNLKTQNEIIANMKLVARQKKPEEASPDWLQFRKAIYDLKNKKWFWASSKYFFHNPIPWDVGDSDETPVMDKLFEEWVGEEKRLLLYEIIAYCLYRDYPIHKIFFFLGRGRNGKSQYLKIIEKFLGKDNMATTDIERLVDNRFESAKLHKKLVAQMGESNYTTFKKTAEIKKLSGGDLISYEYKGKLGFDDYNYAKPLIATNSIPLTHDKTDGFYRRMLIIDFPNQFSEGKDIIKTIPDKEYNNLARKCTTILPELLERQKFFNEPTPEKKRRIYEEKSNPIILFLEEKCENDYYNAIPKWEFAEKLIPWLIERGFLQMKKNEINERMRELYRDSKEWFGSGDNKKQYWAWIGLKWKMSDNNKTNVPKVTGVTTRNPYAENQVENLVTFGTSGTIPTRKDFDWNMKCSICGIIPCKIGEKGEPICENCSKNKRFLEND